MSAHPVPFELFGSRVDAGLLADCELLRFQRFRSQLGGHVWVFEVVLYRDKWGLWVLRAGGHPTPCGILDTRVKLDTKGPFDLVSAQEELRAATTFGPGPAHALEVYFDREQSVRDPIHAGFVEAGHGMAPLA